MILKTKKHIILIIVSIVIVNSLSCATTGLISDRHDEDYYKIQKLLPENSVLPNSSFILYSDNQSGWSIREKFLNKSNWANWRMLLFPFYELYLFGNGAVGTFNWLRNSPDYGANERMMIKDAGY